MNRTASWNRLLPGLLVAAAVVALALWLRGELLRRATSALPPGQPAPEIEGMAVQLGQPDRMLRLSDFRGKVVVVSFWATWCPPCRALLPDEKALVARMQGRPFAYLGVSLDGDPAKLRPFLERERISWPNWVEQGGPISQAWKVRAIPSIFVLDARGVIRYSDVRGKELDEAVETLLHEVEGK